FATRPGDGVDEGHVGTGDRRRSGTAVGLQHVAVEHDRVLGERPGVNAGPQGAPDEPRDLVRAPADPAPDGLAVAARARRAGQHRVLGGHPALTAALAPAGYTFGERGGAEHAGA